MVRRWHLWSCSQGSPAHRQREAEEEIAWLELKGFEAKIWAPRPEHKTSGHVHVAILCTPEDLLKFAGLQPENEHARK